MVSICLSMIVKNESKTILKLLNSCYHLLDSYCICDTGSSDNTKEIIIDFFEKKNISGIIFTDSFYNFGYNRNVTYQRSKNMGDYLLLLDADMILTDNGFNKEELTQDVYLIDEDVRLINTRCSVEVKGPVYEYYDIKKPYTQDNINSLKILNTGKPNYQRNIILLNNSLKVDPNNPRNIFYLANCYKNIGDIENAKKWYQRKLQEKGWNQEVFMTYYNLCEIFRTNLPLLKKYAIEGYQMRLDRIETLYLYFEVLMENQMYEDAYQFAKHIKINKNIEGLFIQQDIYEWKMNYLLSMLYYYVGEYQKGFSLSIELLRENILPEDEYNTVLENIGFYLDKEDFSTDISFLLNKTILSKVAFKQIDRLIMNSKDFDDFRHIPLDLSNNNEIYLFIITDNYKQFKKTMNSFLNHCEDINLISKMICIDNSPQEDKIKINKKFPFFNFIYPEQNLVNSLNLIRNIIRKEKPKYILQLQDNWLFFKKDKYISKMKNILNKKNIHQVLFNQCYANTYEEICLKGFIDNNFYYEQLYLNQEEFKEFTIENGQNNTYWPHYSLRPSLYLGNIYDKLSEFKDISDFEKEFALRYTDEGFKTGFLKGVCCRQLDKKIDFINREDILEK